MRGGCQTGVTATVTGPVVATKAGFERRQSEAGLWDESWTKTSPLLMLGQGNWQFESGFLVAVGIDSDDWPRWWYTTWGERSREEAESDMRSDLLGKTVCVRGRVTPWGPKTAQVTIRSPNDIVIIQNDAEETAAP